MIYTVITFSKWGVPTETQVEASSMAKASVKEYCLVIGKNKFARYYKHKKITSKGKVNRIYVNGVKVFLFTLNHRWQEIHQDDKYLKDEPKEIPKVKPTPYVIKQNNDDYPMISPTEKKSSWIKFDEAMSKYTKEKQALMYAKYAENEKPQSPTTVSSVEIKDSPYSMHPRIWKDFVELVTPKDTATRGNTEQSSGKDNAKNIVSNTW